ncbi:MAG: hypothetical protein LBL62_01810 [Planctomycetaceae bacterium]|jgi:hypothetical protein|nr:hypothetical protein [Planctomycetaceae bacterium]
MNVTGTVLNFTKLNTQTQQRGAVAQGQSLLPYRLGISLAKKFRLFKFQTGRVHNTQLLNITQPPTDGNYYIFHG